MVESRSLAIRVNDRFLDRGHPGPDVAGDPAVGGPGDRHRVHALRRPEAAGPGPVGRRWGLTRRGGGVAGCRDGDRPGTIAAMNEANADYVYPIIALGLRVKDRLSRGQELDLDLMQREFIRLLDQGGGGAGRAGPTSPATARRGRGCGTR